MNTNKFVYLNFFKELLLAVKKYLICPLNELETGKT